MNLTDFYEVYPDEEACEHALREFRECHTLYCPVCGGLYLSWNPSHKSWTCMDCGHEVTLRSGTVMQGSKLPIFDWFVAMFLISKYEAGHIRLGGTAPAWKETLPTRLGNAA